MHIGYTGYSFWIPFWNCNSCTTFFVCRSTSFALSVALSANADTGRLSPSILAIGSMMSLTILTVSGRPVNSLGASASGLAQDAGILLYDSIYTSIDSFVVHFYNCITLLRVRLLSSCFHVLYCFVDRHNVS